MTYQSQGHESYLHWNSHYFRITYIIDFNGSDPDMKSNIGKYITVS